MHRLPPHPTSAGLARRELRRALAEAGHPGHRAVEATAELLVSEVVTNALVHAGTAIDLRLQVEDRALVVEVSDGSRQLPARRNYAATATVGRGLALLDQSADAWGVVAEEHGKTVWFSLTTPGPAAVSPVPDLPTADRPSPVPAATRQPGESDRLEDTVTVELLDTPLLLHSAWHRHAEAMLRECLLATLQHGLDGETGRQPSAPNLEGIDARVHGEAEEMIAAHAAAGEALTLLARHIPSPVADADPRRLLTFGVEPQMTSSRLELRVPRDSVSCFSTLGEMLERAGALARSGRLLTPRMQPEVRSLRRWLCSEVIGQSRGEPPTPWRWGPEVTSYPRAPVRWDAQGIEQAVDAVVVADDADEIIAVSGAAVELLGYGTSEELVGQRLVSIIPPRYRQAHIAGFTMHLLTGRSPLLGNSVVVPALRRDGSEAIVDLLIETQAVGEGRSVYLATLGQRDRASSSPAATPAAPAPSA